jgi:hypothetical protein
VENNEKTYIFNGNSWGCSTYFYCNGYFGRGMQLGWASAEGTKYSWLVPPETKRGGFPPFFCLYSKSQRKTLKNQAINEQLIAEGSFLLYF